ncbi:Protein of unknown function YceH [hydrothermal vent metagenome]|uniref:Uncharacterized protein n=1 Tax=hydrothermal vent metagenome TaxID=652676 RepID=A0A3B0ZB43_9ZZZZ
MKIELDFNETRVLGVMLEKESTTPDQYPLSLNGLMMGCNQKSNREPVVAFDETQVQETVDSLVKKNFVIECTGSRVPKYQHRFANTEFNSLQLSVQALALLCVLFLRGAQTPGELRTRTARLARFADVQAVELALQELVEHSNQAFAVKLPREPGRRDSCFMHLLSGEPDVATLPESVALIDNENAVHSSAAEISLLRQDVTELRQELEKIKAHLGIHVE